MGRRRRRRAARSVPGCPAAAGAHLGDGVAHVGDRAIDRRADLELDEDVAPGPRSPSEVMLSMLPMPATAPSTFCRIWVSISCGAAPGCATVTFTPREGDVGVERHGQADEGHDAHEQQHDEQHHRRDRMPDGPRGNIFSWRALLGGVAVAICTCSPSRRNPPAVLTTRSLPVRPGR